MYIYETILALIEDSCHVCVTTCETIQWISAAVCLRAYLSITIMALVDIGSSLLKPVLSPLKTALCTTVNNAVSCSSPARTSLRRPCPWRQLPWFWSQIAPTGYHTHPPVAFLLPFLQVAVCSELACALVVALMVPGFLAGQGRKDGGNKDDFGFSHPWCTRTHFKLQYWNFAVKSWVIVYIAIQ